MYDLCAIAWPVYPELFILQPCFVAVEAQDGCILGTTVADIEGRLGRPASVQVALGLNVEGFRRWVAGVFAHAL